jgi:type IV pilus assembly protein PilX
MNTYRIRPLRPAFAQSGMALISGMLLLVVMTILALSMFRSFGTQQKIAGNVREKQRATSAAVSAQQFAENWLSSNTPPLPVDCSGMGVSAVAQVCANSPDFSTVPWTLGASAVGVTFSKFNVLALVQPTAPVQGTYYSAPMYYVTDLGASAAGPGEVYQVDATGWGGTTDTVAVVESTYLISPAGRDYGK